ncbi:MAG: energy transducer TonB [Sinobacteraceae bacterium]|nr:energy transducer TonB [Nevskiaceae bacterium]MBV9913215.1 energy transducer TonB [Nevskiaceae bacterium]
MAAYVHDTNFFTRRTAVLAAIVGLHILIAWALATGLARRAIELVAPPLQTEIVEEVQKRDEPPPPPPPQLERPPVEVPPPDVSIEVPVESTSTAIVDVTDKKVTAPPPPPPKATNRVSGGPGKNFPNTEDYYPSASKRLGESGSVIVHACVNASGKLTEEPTVQTTSGNPRLDEGAVKLAKAGSGRYRPATEDGKPIDACFPFKVTFSLKN